MAAKNNSYLANTKFANDNTLNALYDIAGQAGIKNYEDMSTTDLTTAIKKATGTSGNTYGGTIGNATLKNYGYQVDKSGNISKISAGGSFAGGTTVPSAVASGVMKLPGYEDAFPANLITSEIYQQALMNEQLRQQTEQMMEAMQNQYAQQQSALKQQTQATVDSINSNRAGVEDAYQKAQREAYINSVLQQNQMGDYLSAAGYSGGMAESTLAQINNNYANNRQQATSERDAANLEIDRMVAEAQATGNSQLADAANNYYNNYLAALERQQQLDYQLNSDLMSQINAEKQYQLQAAQQRFEEQQYKNQLAQSQKDAQTAASKEQAENDFDTFLNTFEGKYNKKATYEKWIQNLKAMDDPYGYNKQKIAYLQQYINSNFGSGSGSAARSSAAKPSSGGSDSSGPTETVPEYTAPALSSAAETVQNQARMRMNNEGSAFGGMLASSAQNGADGASTYVQSQMNQGKISKSEAQMILQNLGLV